MNYRHIYHAGNFADIFKHFISFLITKQLLKKDKPLMVLDAFAGPALYPLSSTEALKTQEFKDGVDKFINSKFQNSDLMAFQEFLKLSWGKQLYKGSPLQLHSLLRPHDRLIVNELHPDDYKTLQNNMAQFANVKCTNLDAYISIKAVIPPIEKRAYILVDPPFEKRNEFEILIKNIELWHKKFPNGIYAIWYPIKAHDMSLDLIHAVKNIGFHRSYCFEFLRFPRERENSFNGCGMIVMNTPFQIPEMIKAARNEIDSCLNGTTAIELLTTE
jgi:23S rRNA (adenine2030-N6)-methyltransferase